MTKVQNPNGQISKFVSSFEFWISNLARMFQSLLHVILAGLSTGMFIWLVASGLTLIFGVLGVLNFAHGSFYMLGAYFCFTVLKLWGPISGWACL